MIAKAARRGAELTRRLLTFGRKSDHRTEAVQLAAAVAGCFDLLRNTVDRRILWENRVPADLPPLLFNSTDLNQILLNLLLNARDTLLDKLARPHEAGWVPQIQVEAALLPALAAEAGRPGPGGPLLGWQRLTVRDNGLGMAPDVVERIFEPFFTTKEVGKGTGLGLATVWHLVNECGGRVSAESVPGSGSSFHLLLPMWVAAPALPPRVVPPRLPPTGAVRVLLIEDDPLVAETVQALLRRHGHAVEAIADGTEARDHLAVHFDRYDLLVVDVNLPGLSGIEVITAVRTRNFSGRILIMSGRLGLAELRALSQLNVDRVVTKPFNAEQFEAAVRECLAGAALPAHAAPPA